MGKRVFVFIFVLGLCTVQTEQCQCMEFIKTKCYTERIVLLQCTEVILLK